MPDLRRSIILKYQKAVDKARKALANEITIYYRTGNKIQSDAPWDPVNKEVLDGNIEEINGNFFLDEIKTKIIKANYSFIGVGERFKPVYIPAGTKDITDVDINCKLADVLLDTTDLTGDTYFHRATKIMLNGMIFIPKTSTLKYGLGGELYSCYIRATIDQNA